MNNPWYYVALCEDLEKKCVKYEGKLEKQQAEMNVWKGMTLFIAIICFLLLAMVVLLLNG